MNSILNPPRQYHRLGLACILIILAASSIHGQILPTRPVIVEQPQSQTADPGSDATFHVKAEGFLEIRYQWQKENSEQFWEDIEGADQSTLSISNAAIKDATRYRVKVENNIGSRISQSAALRLTGAPEIRRQPEDQSVSLGPDVVFSAFVIGSPPLHYQWFRNGEPIPGATKDKLTIATRRLGESEVEIVIAGQENDVISLDENLVGQGGTLFVQVTNHLSQATSNEAKLEVDASFTKIYESPILRGDAGSGIAWGNYDNDGDPDLFMPRPGYENEGADNLLFQNDGAGEFHEVHAGIVTSDGGVTRGGNWIDFDNDGDRDLFVTNLGNDVLYRNEGKGQFTKIDEGPLVDSASDSLGCSWADYDNNGHLDAYVIHRLDNGWQESSLFHNSGEGDFTRILKSILVSETNQSPGNSGWADYDDDGDLDLFVPNKGLLNHLFRNNSDGTFSMTDSGPIVDEEVETWDFAWGDFDNDGRMDLFVPDNQGGTNRIYRNLGQGHFERAITGELAPGVIASGGCAAGDYDNDGDLDLFIASWNDLDNGLYSNNGDGTFQRIWTGSLANDGGWSMSACWIDLNQDGCLDLMVLNSLNTIPLGRERSPFLYYNNLKDNHWIKIRCVGTHSNRDGIGAKVWVSATIQGRKMTQLREINLGNGWKNSQMPEAHFGLGNADVIDTVRIEWPSGIVQELRQVRADQTLPVTEPDFPVRVQPEILDVPVGQSARFAAQSDQSGPLKFQWQKDRIDLEGETGSILQIRNVRVEEYGRYTVFVESPGQEERFGAIVNLREPIPPTILLQPTSQIQTSGGTAIFDIQATGSPPLRYQWQQRGDESADWIDVTGADHPILEISQLSETDAGDYRVWVLNDFGSQTSDSVKLELVENKPPELLHDLEDQSVSLGATVVFSPQAVGAPPLVYQWRRNGVVLPGINSPDLILTDVMPPDAGLYQVTVSNSLGKTTSREVSLEVDTTFTRVSEAQAPFVDAELDGVGWGAAWGDYDADGNLDLFLPRLFAWVENVDRNNLLYHNQGDGTFREITETPVVTDGGASGVGAWGDYDHDGDLDLWVGQFFTSIDFLYQNQGNGNFVRKHSESFPKTGPFFTLSGCWIDNDNDGNLDFYEIRMFNEGNTLYSYLESPDLDPPLLPNLDSLITENTSKAYGQAWADIDNDMDLDLFVATGNVLLNPPIGFDLLYRNDGGGGFTSMLNSLLVQDENFSLTSQWADFDNDGDFDLYATNARGPNRLFENKGNWHFAEVTDGPHVTDSADSWGCAWGDYDNDGFLDLFVSNGFWDDFQVHDPDWDGPARNVLYRNNRDGQFSAVPVGGPVSALEYTWSATWVDYDNDGFLDLFLVGHPSHPPATKLYKNNPNANHWLKVKCRGVQANSFGIGAKILVTANIWGEEVRQLRQIMTGGSAGNSSVLEAHFGLGDATVIDTLRIEWPGPAFTVQELHDVPVDQILTVVEDVDRPMGPRLEVRVLAGGVIELAVIGEAGKSYEVQVSGDLVEWEVLEIVTMAEGEGEAPITDEAGAGSARRYYRVVEREVE